MYVLLCMLCLIYMVDLYFLLVLFVFKQMTSYEMRISGWSSDVCSSDLNTDIQHGRQRCDIRDRTPAMIDHMRDFVLHAQEHAPQADRHGVLPAFQALLVEFGARC